jgi:phosphocarrier protein HPr
VVCYKHRARESHRQHARAAPVMFSFCFADLWTTKERFWITGLSEEVLCMVNYETKIQLNAINDVKEFVNTVMRFNYDIDLVSGRYAIDAKSIMGIFSLDLSKPIELVAHTEDPDELVKAISKFIVD